MLDGQGSRPLKGWVCSRRGCTHAGSQCTPHHAAAAHARATTPRQTPQLRIKGAPGNSAAAHLVKRPWLRVERLLARAARQAVLVVIHQEGALPLLQWHERDEALPVRRADGRRSLVVGVLVVDALAGFCVVARAILVREATASACTRRASWSGCEAVSAGAAVPLWCADAAPRDVRSSAGVVKQGAA